MQAKGLVSPVGDFPTLSDVPVRTPPRPRLPFASFDNHKPKAPELFGAVAGFARKRLRAGEVLRYSKASPDAAPQDLLDEMARLCGAVVAGTGD